MNRVLVTGNAGSGKSTLTKLLKNQLDLPSYSLDSIVWKSGWVKTSNEELRLKIQKLVESESWIIDGVSELAFRAADTVFFLDIPLYKCIYNILKRFVYNGFKTRESLPENCPEYIGVFKAINVAFVYQRHTRPLIISLIESNPYKKIYWISSYNQLQDLNEIDKGRDNN